MADSEISRTLPAITRRKKGQELGEAGTLPPVIDRRNLLAVAVRLLSAGVIEPDGQRPRERGPTRVREMWPRWYAFHKQWKHAKRRKQMLETAMLEETGGFPVAELKFGEHEPPVVAYSFADINHLSSRLDASKLAQARDELRQRRNLWTNADKRLGYSAAKALERELEEQAGMSGRVMWITRPSSLIEATAKLHCLIAMYDPGLKLEGVPWPELRTMLTDLLHLAAEPSAVKSCDRLMRPLTTASFCDILVLATQYKEAATKLGETLPKSNHLPRRLLALHAIELYLIAVLLAKGFDWKTVHSLQHDLAEQTRLAVKAGLVLRNHTMAHLATLSSSRDYHIVRYAPELMNTLSQANRVTATLEEISKKVRGMLRALP